MMKKIHASQQECERASKRFAEYFGEPFQFPLSFCYDGQEYDGFGEGFDVTTSTSQEKGQIKKTVSARHKSGLHITVDGLLYTDYAAFEWVVHFANSTNDELPLLQNVCAANLIFDGIRPKIYGNIGDDPFFEDIYRPVEMDIVPGMDLKLQPHGGRATSMGFPYYDLSYGEGGVRIAVGWPGRWVCPV